MARSVETILNEMIIAKENEESLSGLNSDSKTAIWRLLFYVVASAIHILEVVLDAFRVEVHKAIKDNRPGTLGWYSEKRKPSSLMTCLILKP